MCQNNQSPGPVNWIPTNQKNEYIDVPSHYTSTLTNHNNNNSPKPCVSGREWALVRYVLAFSLIESINQRIWDFRGHFWSFLPQYWTSRKFLGWSEKWVGWVRMDVLGSLRQSLYHLGAAAVGGLQRGAPPGLENVLLKVSSWGDPSQVYNWLYLFTLKSVIRDLFSTSRSSKIQFPMAKIHLNSTYRSKGLPL